jgi:hypothetical protein
LLKNIASFTGTVVVVSISLLYSYVWILIDERWGWFMTPTGTSTSIGAPAFGPLFVWIRLVGSFLPAILYTTAAYPSMVYIYNPLSALLNSLELSHDTQVSGVFISSIAVYCLFAHIRFSCPVGMLGYLYIHVLIYNNLCLLLCRSDPRLVWF